MLTTFDNIIKKRTFVLERRSAVCVKVLAASTGCHCGATLEVIADKVPLNGIHAKFESRGGTQVFFMVVKCPSCGAIYDPDHKRFSAYFNMAKDRLFD